MPKKITIVLRYPLTLDVGGKRAKLEYFITELDVDLKGIVKTVNEFLWYLDNTSALEYKYIELLYASTGLSNDLFPPISAVSNKFVTWSKKDLEEKFKDLIAVYTSSLYIKNTLSERNMRRFQLDPFPYFKNYYINLFYLKWPLLFKIYPNPNALVLMPKVDTGNFIGPLDSLSGLFLQAFPRYRYNFNYKFYIPIIVDIQQPDAFGNRGYNFRFAIVPGICYMKPCSPKIEARTERNEALQELLCNPKNANKEIEVSVTSSLGKPLNATLEFICGAFSCYYEIKGRGKIKVPECENAKIRAFSPGYLDSTLKVSSVMNFVLPKIFSFDYSIVKAYKITQEDLEEIKKLKPSERRDYIIAHRKEIDDEKILFVATHENSKITFVYSNHLSGKFMLAPGKYNVTATLIKEKKTKFKKCCMSGVIICHQWLEEREINSTPLGITRFTMSISERELRELKKIEIYFYESKLPETMCDLNKWKLDPGRDAEYIKPFFITK